MNHRVAFKVLWFPSSAKGLNAIKAHLGVQPTAPGGRPPGLPLADLHLCEAVFQQRDTVAGEYNMEGHIRVLASALATVSHLDPITVWWGGYGWIVIDGHHRVQAYDRKNYSGEIPVVVFEGSPEDALLESSRLNSRDKLVMTPQEKANAAVRFCLLTTKSKKEIVRATGSSEGTVASIRRVIKSLNDKGVALEEMITKTWKEIKQLNRGDTSWEPPDIDEHTRRLADELRGKMLDVLGENVIFGGDALALALSELPPQLATKAMQSIHWPGQQEEPEEDPDEDY